MSELVSGQKFDVVVIYNLYPEDEEGGMPPVAIDVHPVCDCGAPIFDFENVERYAFSPSAIAYCEEHAGYVGAFYEDVTGKGLKAFPLPASAKN